MPIIGIVIHFTHGGRRTVNSADIYSQHFQKKKLTVNVSVCKILLLQSTFFAATVEFFLEKVNCNCQCL